MSPAPVLLLSFRCVALFKVLNTDEQICVHKGFQFCESL
jgi:hypothetical protein